ncbi:hypothetical protein ADK60_07040 [Streptomyces sp. XY431]|nr:hypothetical protein ADK60_07040 [Streptomyces sp. XY431]
MHLVQILTSGLLCECGTLARNIINVLECQQCLTEHSFCIDLESLQFNRIVWHALLSNEPPYRLQAISLR